MFQGKTCKLNMHKNMYYKGEWTNSFLIIHCHGGYDDDDDVFIVSQNFYYVNLLE